MKLHFPGPVYTIAGSICRLEALILRTHVDSYSPLKPISNHGIHMCEWKMVVYGYWPKVLEHFLLNLEWELLHDWLFILVQYSDIYLWLMSKHLSV